MIVDDAGGVGQQLSNGDVMALLRKLGNILSDVVVEREFAAFHLLHDGDSGKRQHRADDVVDGVRLAGNFEAKVREAVPLVQQDAVAPRDQHRGADHLLLGNDALCDRIEIGLGGLGEGDAGKRNKCKSNRKRDRRNAHARII